MPAYNVEKSLERTVNALPPRLREHIILGNNRSEELERFVQVLETAIGVKAVRTLLPMQPGDVPATYADIEASRRDFGFEPKTGIDEGLPRFVAWYRQYHKI